MSSFKLIIIAGDNRKIFNKYLFKINSKGTIVTSIVVVLNSLLLALPNNIVSFAHNEHLQSYANNMHNILLMV